MAGEVAELPALKEQKRRFDEAGLEGKLSEQRTLAREREQWVVARERLDEHERLLDELVSDARDVGRVSLPDDLVNHDLLGELDGLLAGVDSSWERAADTVRGTLGRTRVRLEELEREWQERFEARRADFDAAVAEVAGEHGEPEIQQYLQLDSRIARLEALDTRVAAHRRTLSESPRSVTSGWPSCASSGDVSSPSASAKPTS